MNKKLLAIVVGALFLMISVGVVSAGDNDAQSISVAASGDMPDEISVSLLCDGKVVKTAVLNKENSWKTTFNVEGDGNYKVAAQGDSDYSISVSGNAEKGFVVKSKLVDEDVLGAADDDQIGVENQQIQPTPLSANGTDDGNDTNNTDNNSTDNNDTDDNNTGGTGDGGEEAPTYNPVNPPVVKKDNSVKDKPVVKKENKTTKAKLKHTGFPVVVLVVAVFAAAFVPFNRRK